MRLARVVDLAMLALGWLCVAGMVVSLLGLIACWLLGVE